MNRVMSKTKRIVSLIPNYSFWKWVIPNGFIIGLGLFFLLTGGGLLFFILGVIGLIVSIGIFFKGSNSGSE